MVLIFVKNVNRDIIWMWPIWIVSMIVQLIHFIMLIQQFQIILHAFFAIKHYKIAFNVPTQPNAPNAPQIYLYKEISVFLNVKQV
jgi:hypothetical protein